MDELIDHVEDVVATRRYPIIGISGHAGAGKSTVARTLENRISGCVRVRGDDFLDPVMVHRRSSDWNGVQRRRLANEVLTPFASGHPVYVRPLDWTRGTAGAPQRLGPARVICVDGIGLFHPDVIEQFDLRIWMDIEPVTAMVRGRARDRAAGLDHDALWAHIWLSNDADFDERFAPYEHADIVFDNNSAPID